MVVKKLKTGKGDLLSNKSLRWNPISKELTKQIKRNSIVVDLSKTLGINWLNPFNKSVQGKQEGEINGISRFNR